MPNHLIQNALPDRGEKIRLEGTFRGKYRVFAVFVICCALLIAAFAISAICLDQGGAGWLENLGSFWGSKDSDPSTPQDSDTDATTDGAETSDDFPNADMIPEGATVIVDRNLAYRSLGMEYIHNETSYQPDVRELLQWDLSKKEMGEAPLVLILHTHTSEAYLPYGTQYIEGAVGNVTYSRDKTQNILSVGEVLCEALNQRGIPTIHCRVLHDDPTLGGSYDRADQTIRNYLEQYPSITYVIDLHRDSLTTNEGDYVRSLGTKNGASVAQVMAVVGTDANGTQHKNWQGNLALALQLRDELNGEEDTVCRPISLRNASYNQEIAPYSLLLEIGTAANSVEEAKQAAVLVGEALADIICP